MPALCRGEATALKFGLSGARAARPQVRARLVRAGFQSSYLVEFEAVDASVSHEHAHEGTELVYVLEGKLGIRIGREEHEVGAGDAIHFDPSVAHAYRRLGQRKCVAIVTTVP